MGMSQKDQTEKKDRQTAAAAALQSWNDERLQDIQKRLTSNRASQESDTAARDASVEGLNPWERVAELIDTKGAAPTDNGQADTSRMRSLLIQLKSSPVVAAA